MNRQIYQLSRWALSLLIVLTSFLIPAVDRVAYAAPDAPTDTPIPVVNEQFNEWTIANGLLYWADRCFGGEFVGPGFLRRKPLNGGTQRTLSTTTAANCVTFLNMAADETGLYYYSSDGFSSTVPRGIHHRPAGMPYDPPQLVVALSPTEVVMPGTRLAVGTEHVYWLTTDFNTSARLLRARKDGTGGKETVATVADDATDLIVVGNTVYWLDSAGLWSTDVTSCSALPCVKKKLENTTGDHLIFRRDGLILGYQIYWVEYGAQQKIRRRSCHFVIQLPIDPPIGSASIAAPEQESCSTTTLYTAPSDHAWQLGRPSTDGNNLFWQEYYLEIGGSSDGRLRRKPIGGIVSGPAVDIAVNLGTGAAPTELYNGYVYFAHQGLKKLAWDAAPIVRDLTANSMEVTQGIQSLNNDVPLIAKKETYVRAYGRQNSGPSAVAVKAQLKGTRNGNPLPGSPLNSINGALNFATGAVPDRANRNDGWLFQLPSSWISKGNVTLELVVDPLGTYSDPNLANNKLSRTISFQEKAPICTVFVPVRTHAPKATTDLASFWPMVDMAEQMLPTANIKTYKQNSDIAELQVCWWGPFPHPCFGPYELPSDDWKIMASLWTRDLFSDDPDSCDDANAVTHYVGLIHPNTSTDGLNGKGNRPGANLMIKMPPLNEIPLNWRKWSDNEPRSPRAASFPHELGHNYNRKHIACGSPKNPDNNYPYTNPDRCRLDDGALDAAGTHYAWDIQRLQPTAPDAATDLMSYGRPRWPSDYTWKAIFNRIDNNLAAASVNETMSASADGVSAAGVASAFAQAESIVLVTGAYTPTNVVENGGLIDYAYVFPKNQASNGQLRKWQQSTMSVFAAVSSESTLVAQEDTVLFRLLDAGAALLAEQPATILALEDDENEQLAVAATLPEPTGDVATVQLVVNGTVVASRTPGTALPTISLSQPAGGETVDQELTVMWSAADTDNADRLLYVVQYSHDNGGHWRTVSNGIAGPGNKEGDNVLPVTVKFNASDLPGSNGQNALVRVFASDGYHTASATSQPFTVTTRKPEPFILSPYEGTSLPADQPILLRGGASDAEDGSIEAEKLSWRVNGNNVGTGESQIITGLGPGQHTIALTAEDSDGNMATLERTVTVRPLEIASASTPTLDGFCDDAGYAEGTQLQLAPYTTGSSSDHQATVQMVRSGSYLYTCFNNMVKGSATPGAFAGIRIDKNNSRDKLAQSDDYGFFIGEDGGQFTYAGDGAGGMAAAGPGGLVAQISVGASTWAAELRIDAAVVDGWEHPVSLNLGHYWVNSQGDDYEWPYITTWNKPNTWAETAFGTTPKITTLSQNSVTASTDGFTLVISGSNFIDGAIARLGTKDLTTAFGSSSIVSATVPAAAIAGSSVLSLTVRNPGDLTSAPVRFMVNAPRPTITTLDPDAVDAGSAAINLIVNGSDFLNGAVVLWDGVPLTTTFVNSSQLNAQVAADRLTVGSKIGIAVRNPGLDSEATDAAIFTVKLQDGESSKNTIFLPLVAK